jgi:hypothetical protein
MQKQTESVQIATKSPLEIANRDVAAIKQGQSEDRLAAETAGAVRKGNLASLVTRKRAELENEKKALENANRKLADARRTEDKQTAEAEIVTASGNIQTLEAELATLTEMLR